MTTPRREPPQNLRQPAGRVKTAALLQDALDALERLRWAMQGDSGDAVQSAIDALQPIVVQVVGELDEPWSVVIPD